MRPLCRGPRSTPPLWLCVEGRGHEGQRHVELAGAQELEGPTAVDVDHSDVPRAELEAARQVAYVVPGIVLAYDDALAGLEIVVDIDFLRSGRGPPRQESDSQDWGDGPGPEAYGFPLRNATTSFVSDAAV